MCELAGIHRLTWYRWAARARDGRFDRGSWPAAVRERIDKPAREMALRYRAWGHRKIWALLEGDGHEASQATVRRALRARALLQPPGANSERRQLARVRRAAFVDPPARRNRVWQTDFSELQTLGQGSGSSAASSTTSARSALPARSPRPKHGATPSPCSDARDRAADLIGRSLLEDCTDPQTGEIVPVVVVFDNGSCYRAAGFACHMTSVPSSRTSARAIRRPRPTA
jgi:putative transposase